MASIFPHQMFQADFLTMLPEVRRQEELDPIYSNETDIGKEIFFFFGEQVLPLVKTNNSVFDAGKHFATEYAEEYFIMLKRTRSVKDVQTQLTSLREEVTCFLKAAMKKGIAPPSIQLVKPSDFLEVIELDNMSPDMQREAARLHNEAVHLERFYVDVALQGTKALYEKGLPRIFYLIKIALKVKMNAEPTKADSKLLAPHQCINWCRQQLPAQHILHRVLVDNSELYKVVRNVDSHEKGLKWLPESNEVFLPDRDNPLTVHVNDLAQKYRFLMYLCEIGVRGILAVFTDRERGPISNKVKNVYLRVYDNPELEARMRSYPV